MAYLESNLFSVDDVNIGERCLWIVCVLFMDC